MSIHAFNSAAFRSTMEVVPSANTGALNNLRDTIPAVITRVRASEAEHLSGFSSACFDGTYGPMCRAADVDSHIAEYLSPSAWLKVLTDGTSWVFAAEIDEQWTGYAHLQLAALPEGSTPVLSSAPGITPIEICRFYVARRWQGQGVAQTLMSWVLEHAALQGAESVWLSSWQENARANAFYAKWNFERVGTATFAMGEDVQQDYLMQHVLAKRVSG